ncbi:unnamed protein product, partial [marine sediment metagenome]
NIRIEMVNVERRTSVNIQDSNNEIIQHSNNEIIQDLFYLDSFHLYMLYLKIFVFYLK